MDTIHQPFNVICLRLNVFSLSWSTDISWSFLDVSIKTQKKKNKAILNLLCLHIACQQRLTVNLQYCNFFISTGASALGQFLHFNCPIWLNMYFLLISFHLETCKMQLSVTLESTPIHNSTHNSILIHNSTNNSTLFHNEKDSDFNYKPQKAFF